MKSNLGKNLKKLRLQKGLTQEKLGTLLEKDYSTIGKWELEQRSPSIDDALRISEYFNITLQDLVCKKL